MFIISFISVFWKRFNFKVYVVKASREENGEEMLCTIELKTNLREVFTWNWDTSAKFRLQLYYAVIYLSGLCSGDVRHPAAVRAELPLDGGGAVHGGHPQDPGRPPRLLDHLHPGGAQQTLHVRLLRHPQCGNVHSNVFYLEPPVGLQIWWQGKLSRQRINVKILLIFFQNVYYGSIVASILQVLAPTSIEYVLVGGTF